MSDQFSIRPAVSTDRPQWELLWGGYLEFYESAVPASNTEILWQRILDAEHPIRCLLAAAPAPRSPLLGMVQFFPHLDTWEEHMVCYMQDLYVVPDARRRGLGRALIQAVQTSAEHEGWQFVYWLTARDNHAARRLYDRLTSGENGHMVYQLGKGSDVPTVG